MGGEKNRHKPIFVGLVLALLWGGLACQKERPLRPVVANEKRVPKSALNGTYVYLRSLTSVNYLEPKADLLAPGIYEASDQLVQFVLKENSVDVVAIDPWYREQSDAEKNGTLLSFPARHVDILRKQNADGNDTNEEEETETRRPWKERDYVVIDLSQNLVDNYKNIKVTDPGEKIEIDDKGNINFTTAKQLSDDTLIGERYSFLKFRPSSTYTQREYPRELQNRFGLFKTTTFQFDPYGRMVQSLKKDYMSRWDFSRQVVYYYSADFPVSLKPYVAQAFSHWNDALKKIIGKAPLELRENSGQQTGDLRYNLIVYEPKSSPHGLLGYGPAVTNPRTGEILKADVFVYGGTLREAIYNERLWMRLLSTSPSVPASRLSDPERGDGEDHNEPLFEKLSTGRLLDTLDRLKPAATLSSATAFAPLQRDTSALESLRARTLADNNRRLTRLTTATLSAIHDSVAAGGISDEGLEAMIFAPLITHELGHNLGLRHNFMASADERHFAPGLTSSSVMDYGVLAAKDSPVPGSYDEATLAVAYGDSAAWNHWIQERYFYCSDESLYDSRYGLCHIFDSGTTLSAEIENQSKRYQASFLFNNRRLDRVHFGKVDSDYLNRVFEYLVPIRLWLDHAQAILSSGKKAFQGDLGDLSEEDLVNLWRLLRQRIESDPSTEAPLSVRTSSGYVLSLDKQKIARCLADAQKARDLAFSALSLVVKSEGHSDYDQEDPVWQDLQVRGVLYDRLIALTLLGIKLPDPLRSGSGSTVFEPLHKEMAELLGGVLSNTDTVATSGQTERIGRLKVYDPNVRDLAASLFDDLAKGGSLESGEAKELLRLQAISATDGESITKYNELREQFRKSMLELELARDSETENRLRAEMLSNRKAAAKLNFTLIHLRDGLSAKAPLLLPEFESVPTASGRLVHDNLNVMEDRLWVVQQLGAKLEGEISLENYPTAKLKLVEKRRQMLEMALIFSRYVESERTLAEKIYRAYSPR